MSRKITAREQPWDYIPDIGENRSDPDPLVVTLRPLTGAQSRHIDAVSTVGVGPDRRMALDVMVEETIKAGVVSVKGYERNGRQITTAKELLDLGEDSIVGLVFTEIRNGSVMSLGEQKNS